MTTSDVVSSENQDISGERFIQVKKTYSRRKHQDKIKGITLANKFEGLENEPVNQSNLKASAETANSKEKIRNLKKERIVLVENPKKGAHTKKERCWFSQFEIKNLFNILEDIHDDCIPKVIETVEKETSKQCLKKCRFCNFKKRSCMLNPESCQAKKKSCWSCNKLGHFPQSLCCKKNRKSMKIKYSKVELDQPNSNQILREHIDLIIYTINRLDNLKKVSEKTEDNQFRNRNKSGENEECERKIMHSAKYCARKFENINIEDNKLAFTKYCSKKVETILKSKSGPLPNSEGLVSLQRKLEVFENVFHNTSETISELDGMCNNLNEEVVPAGLETNDSIQLKSNALQTPYEERELQRNLEADENVYLDMNDQFLQVDGGCDTSLDEEIVPNCLYSVNCENKVLTTWFNFFRSFDFLWETSDHCICIFEIPNSEETSCFSV